MHQIGAAIAEARDVIANRQNKRGPGMQMSCGLAAGAGPTRIPRIHHAAPAIGTRSAEYTSSIRANVRKHQSRLPTCAP
jgi:hypothetical protein